VVHHSVPGFVNTFNDAGFNDASFDDAEFADAALLILLMLLFRVIYSLNILFFCEQPFHYIFCLCFYRLWEVLLAGTI
jgi:hypothetical protein